MNTIGMGLALGYMGGWMGGMGTSTWDVDMRLRFSISEDTISAW